MVKGVIDILKANNDLVDLLGLDSKGEPKIYPVVAPQSEKHPYIAVRQSSGLRPGKNCGFNGNVNVVAYSKSFDDLSDIVEKILEACEQVNNSDINSLTLSNVADDFVTKSDGDGLYAKVITFDAMYERN